MFKISRQTEWCMPSGTSPNEEATSVKCFCVTRAGVFVSQDKSSRLVLYSASFKQIIEADVFEAVKKLLEGISILIKALLEGISILIFATRSVLGVVQADYRGGRLRSC